MNKSTGDGVGCDDDGVVDAGDGTVGVVGVTAMDLRFASDEKCHVYIRLKQNWSNLSCSILS
jgi:Ethanolamine utilization protein EutJ (predicted chaperonin)